MQVGVWNAQKITLPIADYWRRKQLVSINAQNTTVKACMMKKVLTGLRPLVFRRKRVMLDQKLKCNMHNINIA